jgi:hypothetical protein
MNKAFQGVSHGTTIQLNENPGLPDGQTVEVVVQSVQSSPAWGDGIRRSAGGMAGQWTAEDQEILDEIHKRRDQDSHREIPA